MKKLYITGLLVTVTSFLLAQDIDQIINAAEVERIEKVLSSDDMKGRNTFSPELDKAADFITAEFKKTGLETFDGLKNYKQTFTMLKPVSKALSCKLNGKKIPGKEVIVISAEKEIFVNERSGYQISHINAGDKLSSKANGFINAATKQVVFVDASFSATFPKLVQFKKQLTTKQATVIFILTSAEPKTFSVKATQSLKMLRTQNVVAVLPGKSLKNEYVIFSGHYDHIGIGKPVNGDSIYNGANDDAAGTTAVLMLAKYFRALNNNERTLIFATFTAEEIGGFGSQYFSKQLKPEAVVAMFNIEMIGTESKWGKNSAYITGFEKTDMGDILDKNLAGTAFKFYPDPYTSEKLFYRSDNATLAKLGVPAHSISTSKMDDEPNYHKPSDEIGTLDMNNMAEVIKAIALSSKTIISGKDTPTRVKEEAAY